jgi:beta-phosphoglucomutase-like phosphatase (HAD superfamily)
LDNLNTARCIVSNSSKHYIERYFTLTNQSIFFNKNAIFTSNQFLRPKPFPDVLLFAAKEMAVKPQNCIVIEDRATGACAAIAAGMQVMMFLAGSHARFKWYQDKLAVYDVPKFFSCQDLSHAIRCALK